MLYREIRPSSPLDRVVETFWFLQGRGSDADGAHKLLPDGSPEIVLNLGDDVWKHGRQPSTDPQPRILAAGQLERYLELELTGQVDLVGIRFHPFGAAPLLRVPMVTLTEQTPSLDALDPRLAADLERAVRTEASPTGRQRALEAVLRSRSAWSTSVDLRIIQAVAEIRAANGCLSVTRLARSLDWSTRHLRRQFREHVGVTPKQLARTLRFQGVFDAMSRSHLPGWVEIALDNGYYDQAHFIREFKEFAGEPPGSFFAVERPVTDRFTRRSLHGPWLHELR